MKLLSEEEQRSQQTADPNLDTLVKKSTRTLYEISSVFPFDIFPDKLVIDEEKVSIVYRDFFFVKHIFPIAFRDLRTATVRTSFFLAAMDFEIIGYETNPPVISNLKRGEALRARRIITGMLTAVKEGVNISDMPLNRLLTKLETMGREY